MHTTTAEAIGNTTVNATATMISIKAGQDKATNATITTKVEITETKVNHYL